MVPADDVGPVTELVKSYFDGDLAALDEVVVEQRTDGGFMAHAWQVMRGIKPGAPVTYTEFAACPAGRPRCARQRRRAPATRWRCSPRVTGCCGGTARSAATAGGCR